MWTVYVLKCSDNTHYVGCTGNLDERLKRHEKGQVSCTKTRLPFEVIVLTIFPDKYKAFKYEKYLKSGSGRAFAKRHYLN